MNEREKRKEALKRVKEQERRAFLNSLPLDEQLFRALFDFLDENLNEDCNHKMRLTLRFLAERKITQAAEVLEWLHNRGAYCDCEILYNVEEQFG